MNNLKGKTLLVLGGIAFSNEIIARAKRKGIKVYVTDYLVDSPAKKNADKHFLVSTTDVEAIVDLIHTEKIDGVITGFIDLLLPFYQQACNLTQKPCYATLEQIELLSNKAKFKNLCNEFKVPVVEEFKLKYPLVDSEISQLTYPVLIKPTDNSGGKGIFICNNPQDLKKNYKKALEFSSSKQIIVERYMRAQEASIFYSIVDGEIFLTAMGERHVNYFKEGIIPLPVAYTFPSNYLKAYEDELHPKVVKMFKSLNLQNGMIFIQSFVENNQCIFYEMGYRLTGSLEYKIIEDACGFNPLDDLIEFALTGKNDTSKIKKLANPHFKKKYCNITFLAMPGVISKISGINKVLTMRNVLDVFCSYNEGDTIPENAIGTLAQAIIRVFAKADTKSELANLMQEIHATIKVENVKSENMILPTFDTNKMFVD